MASDFVVGLIVGLVGCLLLTGLFGLFGLRRIRRQQADALADRELALGELRSELAEDKETNRRLRHELAVKTPGNLVETANIAEMERNAAISERDQALEQLGLVDRDLTTARTRLAEQETKLRRYREALQEIRLSLEAQGRSRSSLGGAASMLDTGEITGDDLAPQGVAEGPSTSAADVQEPERVADQPAGEALTVGEVAAVGEVAVGESHAGNAAEVAAETTFDSVDLGAAD